MRRRWFLIVALFGGWYLLVAGVPYGLFNGSLLGKFSEERAEQKVADGKGMQKTAVQRVRMVEWNVENLFDCSHDQGFDDKEYLPDGSRRWTPRRFTAKMLHLSKTLIALSASHAPDLIALTEVENDSVMTFLTRRSILRNVGYDYIMTHGDDPRGIDVALLFLRESFLPLYYRSLRMPFHASSPSSSHQNASRYPTSSNRSAFTGRSSAMASAGKLPRDVLYVAGRLQNGDTLHVFVCHLPSKLNGRRGKLWRDGVCRMIRDVTDSLQMCRPDANIVITGDFNDSPFSRTIADGLGAVAASDGAGKNDDDNGLCNLSSSMRGEGDVKGTYKYNGRWEILDQCIVSRSMLRENARVRTSVDDLHLGALDFIMTKDELDGKCKPWRTFDSYKYINGYSDHLPIYLDLWVNFAR